ncbi:MAG: prepilin-type N-terminal cleavage/methylation domain-containing protein [Candidatus Kerfeldbacteria bacterium]|nr:prepilin-type N-terminal cleavage/methylation domain-containing protein [Candidatus Kerfeldbacteria bacterium]
MYYEAYTDESLARRREQRLKHHGNAIRELKLRMINQPIKKVRVRNRFGKSGAGFTLVEMLISIAIFALLTVVIFSNFAGEKDRSSTKRAAEQLQVDLQAMQNNAQSGVPDQSTGALVTKALPVNVTITTLISYDNLVPTNPPPGSLSIAYSTPNGTASIKGDDLMHSSHTSADIIVKNTRLGVCYKISVVAPIGTVTSRAKTACP